MQLVFKGVKVCIVMSSDIGGVAIAQRAKSSTGMQ